MRVPRLTGHLHTVKPATKLQFISAAVSVQTERLFRKFFSITSPLRVSVIVFHNDSSFTAMKMYKIPYNLFSCHCPVNDSFQSKYNKFPKLSKFISMFCWPCIIVYHYNETNVMHFSFNLLRIKSLYMFRALRAHPHDALHKRHLVYCARIRQHFSSDFKTQLYPSCTI
jgi:hypothetical protein